MSISLVDGGRFVSTGAGKTISLPGGADYFRSQNLTQLATTQTPGRGILFEWYGDGRVASDNAIEWKKSDGTNVVNNLLATTGGFTYFVGTPPPGAVITGTTITAANPAVASAPNSFSNGDRVRIYDVTGMRQISTMMFSVDMVTSTTFRLPGLNSSGFAAPATAFKVQKVAPFEQVLPEYMFITSISTATQAVLGVSALTTGVYAPGMRVRVDIPSGYGMQEINGLSGVILAVGLYTLTVDINTSGFSAFAFPASAPSVSLPRFATVAPAGQKAFYDTVTGTQYGYNVNEGPFRSTFQSPFMFLAAGIDSPAGSNADVIEWQAFRYE